MIFVTPFYPDFLDFGNYASALRKQGQCDGHQLIVITQRKDEEKAIEFVKKVEKLFSETQIKVVDPVGGVTAAANEMFKAAIYAFRPFKKDSKVKVDVPMLYADPTWHPKKQGWLDTIQGEFFAKGMPKVLCRWKANKQGERLSWGPVLFSRAYAVDAPLIPSIPARIHWREYLRYELHNSGEASYTISSGAKGVLKPVESLKQKK